MRIFESWKFKAYWESYIDGIFNDHHTFVLPHIVNHIYRYSDSLFPDQFVIWLKASKKI